MIVVIRYIYCFKVMIIKIKCKIFILDNKLIILKIVIKLLFY